MVFPPLAAIKASIRFCMLSINLSLESLIRRHVLLSRMQMFKIAFVSADLLDRFRVRNFALPITSLCNSYLESLTAKEAPWTRALPDISYLPLRCGMVHGPAGKKSHCHTIRSLQWCAFCTKPSVSVVDGHVVLYARMILAENHV